MKEEGYMNGYKEKSDAELLQFLQEDEKAFNELYHRYHRLVYYVAYELCRNDADAKDVMQETFVKVRKAANGLREPEKFKYWLNAVTISRCKDLFKKNKYGNSDSETGYLEDKVIETRRYLLPEKELHFKSDQAMLHHFIDLLPQNQKEILLLKFFADMPIKDIAELYDISEGTVKSRIHYAKQSLRGMVENYNQKDKNKPLNFEVSDAIVAAAFTYAFHKGQMFFYRPKLHNMIKSPFSILAVSTCVVVTSGVLLQRYFKQEEPNLTRYAIQNEAIHKESTNDESKNAYFDLMDWAACPSDMEIKSEADIQEILPLYQLLKERNDAYYQLLLKQNWVEPFEEICMK